MTTIYVAGPMTGLPDFNHPAFYAAETALSVAGYDVENPARNEPEGTAAWLAYMRMSLVQIAKSDGIALLPGWESSKGARIEAQLADDMGIPLGTVETWVRAGAR